MTFEGFGGLNINGLVVDEFGYLLRYYSGGQVDTFCDIEAVASVSSLVEGAAAKELTSGVLREEEALNVTKATAENNLKNLISIVRAISDYVAECKRLDLPIDAGHRKP